MSLLDYYRQFGDMEESEYNELLRDRRAREKALALEHVPVLDLTTTEWPEYPNADVVGASVYAARGRLNRYPDHHATGLRRVLAERHVIKSDQIVIGNGALELIQSAAHGLLSQGDEVLIPWPSYFLYPTVVLRAGGRPVFVDLADGRADTEALLAAITERTRVIIVCNPNDPTGTYLDADTLGTFLSRVPDHVHVLLDEAYVHFQDVDGEDAGMKLVEAFPHLLVFRTFSKIFGLSGLRVGYAIGSPAAPSLLNGLAPLLGVSVPAQAAVAQALRISTKEIPRRRSLVIAERRKLVAELEELGIPFAATQANFVWLRVPGMTGSDLAGRLETKRVRVASGGPLGDDDHVRASIRSSHATERLLGALRQVLAERDGTSPG